jgi:hypothetical protein
MDAKENVIFLIILNDLLWRMTLFHAVVYWLCYCTMLGFLTTSDHQLYRVTPLKTPFGLVLLLFQSQSHVTTIIHNYSLRCVTFTPLTILPVRNYNHLLHSYTFVITITHNYLLRCYALTQLQSLHANIPFLMSTHINIQFTLRADCDVFVKRSPRSYSANLLLKTDS